MWKSLSTNGDILSIAVLPMYCKYSIYWFRVGVNSKSNLSNLHVINSFFSLYTLAIDRCVNQYQDICIIFLKLKFPFIRVLEIKKPDT